MFFVDAGINEMNTVIDEPIAAMVERIDDRISENSFNTFLFKVVNLFLFEKLCYQGYLQLNHYRLTPDYINIFLAKSFESFFCEFFYEWNHEYFFEYFDNFVVRLTELIKSSFTHLTSVIDSILGTELSFYDFNNYQQVNFQVNIKDFLLLKQFSSLNLPYFLYLKIYKIFLLLQTNPCVWVKIIQPHIIPFIWDSWKKIQDWSQSATGFYYPLTLNIKKYLNVMYLVYGTLYIGEILYELFETLYDELRDHINEYPYIALFLYQSVKKCEVMIKTVFRWISKLKDLPIDDFLFKGYEFIYYIINNILIPYTISGYQAIHSGLSLMKDGLIFGIDHVILPFIQKVFNLLHFIYASSGVMSDKVKQLIAFTINHMIIPIVMINYHIVMMNYYIAEYLLYSFVIPFMKYLLIFLKFNWSSIKIAWKYIVYPTWGYIIQPSIYLIGSLMLLIFEYIEGYSEMFAENLWSLLNEIIIDLYDVIYYLYAQGIILMKISIFNLYQSNILNATVKGFFTSFILKYMDRATANWIIVLIQKKIMIITSKWMSDIIFRPELEDEMLIERKRIAYPDL